MNFCINCKHLIPSTQSPEFHKCGRSEKRVTNLVTGAENVSWDYCDVQRKYPNIGMCGPDGIYFEREDRE